MIWFAFNQDKAKAAVLYAAGRLMEGRGADLHRLVKVLYFAERKHLVRYGRPIIGDWYVAMKYGPVPSNTYEAIKTARCGDPFGRPGWLARAVEVEDHYVRPLVEPDLDEFSDSDMECLDESINENRSLGFKTLTNKAHGPAWRKAPDNGPMDFADIAMEEGAATPALLEALEAQAENERLLAR